MATGAYQRTRYRPTSNNLELWSWYFFRVSGILLLFLAYVHFAIMHLVNNVDVVDYDFVAQRWGSVLWRIFDWLLLSLALTHGVNGLRIVIDDYVHRHGWRVLAISALWVVYFALLVIGTLTIVTFQPVAGGR